MAYWHNSILKKYVENVCVYAWCVHVWVCACYVSVREYVGIQVSV